MVTCSDAAPPQMLVVAYYAAIACFVYVVYTVYFAEKNQFSGQWLYVMVFFLLVMVMDNMLKTRFIAKIEEVDKKCPNGHRRD